MPEEALELVIYNVKTTRSLGQVIYHRNPVKRVVQHDTEAPLEGQQPGEGSSSQTPHPQAL